MALALLLLTLLANCQDWKDIANFNSLQNQPNDISNLSILNLKQIRFNNYKAYVTVVCMLAGWFILLYRIEVKNRLTFATVVWT